MSHPAFSPAGQGKTLTLSVTASNTQGSFDYPTASNAGEMMLVNAGTKTCFVRWGGSAQTATTSDFPVLAGQSALVDASGAQYIAAICGGTDSTTLYVVPGNNG